MTRTAGSVESRRSDRESARGGLAPAGELARPLRIAQVIPQKVHPYSGLLVAVCRLAAWLRVEGFGVELWQVGDLSPEAEALLEEAVDAGAVRRRLPSPRIANDSARQAWELAESEVDIAHLHGVFNLVNVRVASRLKVPFVITPHGGYAPESLSYHRIRKEIFRVLLELPMLRRAGAIGALTDQEREHVEEFGARGEISVIPNGVDAPPSGVDSGAFRREYGIPEDAPLAVYIGRLDVRAKRLDDVIRGVAASPGWRLALVGGDFRDGISRLRRTISAAGIGDRTWVVPPRRGRRLHEVLAASDAFVLLSRSEGMPMALLEATSWGVPAIVSPEVDRTLGVVALGAGWRVSPERLGDALLSYASEGPAERAARMEAARAFARRYDWRTVALSYGELYLRALRDADRSPAMAR